MTRNNLGLTRPLARAAVFIFLLGVAKPTAAQDAPAPEGESSTADQPASEDTKTDPEEAPVEDAEETTDEPTGEAAPAEETAVAPASTEVSASVEVEATRDVPSAPVEPEAAPAAAPEKKASSWTDHIELMGDFRYRFEIIDTENMEMRYRHRIRARLGIIANVVDSVEIGIQAATGSEDPVSTNQSLDNAFSTKPFGIDLAYAAWRPGVAEGLALVAGKMKNPFVTVSKTELIWDPDLTPEGIALGYRNAFGVFEPFIQTGGFFVEERSSEADSWILGLQGGLQLNFMEGVLHVIAGGGYLDHTNIKGSDVYFDSTDNMGNSAALADPADPEAEDLVYLNDYNLVEAFLEVGGKAGRFPWGVFGTTVINVAASDDNLGWLVGGRFGKVKEALDFDLRYIYRQVDRDAVVGIFTDSDFRGGGTDGTGHEFNAGLGLAKNVKLAATYFLNERPLRDNVEIDGVAPETGTELFHRFQLDFKFKF